MNPFLTTSAILLISFTVFSQSKKSVQLVVEPSPFVVTVGETEQVSVRAIDSEGNQLENLRLVFRGTSRFEGSSPSSGALVDSLGNITGQTPGIFRVTVIRPGNKTEGYTRKSFQIQVVNAPVAEIKVINLPEKLYSKSSILLNIEAMDKAGFEIDPSKVKLRTDNNSIATVDVLGNLRLHSPGNFTLYTSIDGVENAIKLMVIENPVSSLDLSVDLMEARTGDVLTCSTISRDVQGNTLTAIPVKYSIFSNNTEKATGSSAIITTEGKFVAEKPGLYDIVATTGKTSAIVTVKIFQREVEQEIELIGQGTIDQKRTSDLWIWEGVDGRDYAVTGTHSADGTAYFWDVTNPGSIILLDSVQVDARTVNDVKVSEDGRICIISREGASNRKNGIVILDVSDPKDVKIISTYTENLTGGVHNLYIYKDHVYALSNTQRYDVINISDPAKPYRVSSFEIENPARAIHDVWIEDGIAYSSNWNDGVIMVDVGNGIAGGSAENPVEIMRVKVEGDANHAAFPFKSKSTGKRYVVAGDEIFNFKNGMVITGYVHFVDISDPENPEEVARYEVPEAGSHNLWILDDVLYIGYYNGGLRVVDISGELLGDLYKQGREIAYFLPKIKTGISPNSPMTWGAQPHKGHVYFSDMNSGLWTVKVKPVKPEETKIDVR